MPVTSTQQQWSPYFQLWHGVDTNNLELVREAIKNQVDINITLIPGEYDRMYNANMKQERSTLDPDHSDLATRIDESKMTPLLLALSKEYLEMAELLIRHPNINVNLSNEVGITPLYMLLMVSNRGLEDEVIFDQRLFNLFKQLVEKGASTEEKKLVSDSHIVNLESRALYSNRSIFEYLSGLPTTTTLKQPHYIDDVRSFIRRINAKTSLDSLRYIMKRPKAWRDSVIPQLIDPGLIKYYASLKPTDSVELELSIQLITQLMNIAFTYNPLCFNADTFKGYLEGAGSDVNSRIKALLIHPKKQEVTKNNDLTPTALPMSASIDNRDTEAQNQFSNKKQAVIEVVAAILETLKSKINDENIPEYKQLAQIVHDNLQAKLTEFKDPHSPMTAVAFKEQLCEEIKLALPQFKEAQRWKEFFLNILRAIANLFLSDGNKYTLFKSVSYENIKETGDSVKNLSTGSL